MSFTKEQRSEEAKIIESELEKIQQMLNVDQKSSNRKEIIALDGMIWVARKTFYKG